MALIQILHRRDTAANWTSANPILGAGEYGLDTTSMRVKIGDGATAWSSLAYQMNTVFSGAGAPAGGLGVNGDIYFDTTGKALYTKASGSWTGPISLQGAQGIQGVTGQGVPTGGTTNQVLKKNSGTDYDTSWAGIPSDGTTIQTSGGGIISIANGGVSNVKLANMASATFKGQTSGGSGAPVDLSAAQAKTALAIANTDVSGLGTLSTQSGTFSGTHSGSSSGTNTGDQTITLTGPVTGTGTGSFATSVTADAITNVMLSNMVAGTLKGSVAGGDPADLTGTQVTALLDTVTTTVKGLMLPLDKKIIDNLHYDFVADFGGVGNDSTLNDTAMATAISTMPVGATLFFPAGTYRFASVIDINVDKRFTFRGVNRYASIIKTTSATANIFHKTVAGWYDSWADLGFQSSVTRTGGAAIAVTPGNNVGMNVYRCWFTGMFYGINYDGNQSGNLSVINDLDISAITNGGRGIRINGATINVMIHNVTMNGGAATTSACMEIIASGAVQVTNCDWIQGTNVVLFNAPSALGAQACYFTNCFFDQPQGDVVLVTGGFTHNRLKFTQCGLGVTGNNNGIHINGTGAGGAGTATALPAGISVVDCDIYSALPSGGSSTGAGVRVAGCQDINVQNSRFTGFAGATTGAGIRVIPSAGNVTKVRINGNIIGPNSNLTGGNTIGIAIEAGSSALASLSVSDNTLLGNTTPLTDASTIVAGQVKNITQNTGHPAGFITKATHGATVLTTVDTVVMSFPIPANTLTVGTTFLVDYIDTSAVTNAATVRFRIGTAGTTADTGVLAMTAVATATSVSGRWVVTCTAVGAGTATFFAGGIGNATPTAGTALSVAFNSTVANFLTMSIASGASTTRTVRGGAINCVG